MEAEILSASAMGLELTELLIPFMAAMTLLVVTLWIKDVATSIAKGLMFRFGSAFSEGDHVLLDNERALVVSIGFTQTVFGVTKNNKYCWRYVPNEKIHSLKLEKIVIHDLSAVREDQ